MFPITLIVDPRPVGVVVNVVTITLFDPNLPILRFHSPPLPRSYIIERSYFDVPAYKFPVTPVIVDTFGPYLIYRSRFAVIYIVYIFVVTVRWADSLPHSFIC